MFTFFILVFKNEKKIVIFDYVCEIKNYKSKHDYYYPNMIIIIYILS